MESFLKQLNEVGSLQFKPTKPIKDLEIGKVYAIVKMYTLKTKFGRQIKVDLGEFECFLPTRFSKMLTDEKVATLTNVGLVFNGMKQLANGREGADINIQPLD